ncbi:MAG: AAA family ATPase, partial [Myxococcota bacterium]
MSADPEEREWLSETDLRFGQSLMRFDPTADEMMRLLGAAVCSSVRAGHVCFTEELAPPKMRASIRAAICHRGTRLLGDGNSVTPLITDGSGRVYLHRYYQRERQVAAALHARATIAPNPIASSTLAAVNRLFGSDPGDESRAVAIRALESNLLVITGGPGSGKTTTVVRLLALLAEDAQQRGLR